MEEETRRQFPDARVMRWDQDAVRRAGGSLGRQSVRRTERKQVAELQAPERRAVDAEQPQFVLHCGDITDYGSDEEFAASLGLTGKTVIAIAHRLSTIAAMDRLVVMDEGRIVEEGSHAELLRARGLYARLWERQSGGFLGAAEQTRRIA